MPGLSRSVVAVLLIFAGGCQASSSTSPAPLPSSGEPFEVTGVVTDEHGGPLAGASVTMSHYLGGFSRRPSVQTDASGGYTINFTATPWGMGTSRGAARAEIFTLDHDRYQRTVIASGPRLVENFRLHRITRIPAGDSIVLSVSPDNGDCLGWLYPPCGRVRVTAATNGNLTLAAEPAEAAIDVGCVSGSEVYGNPVSLRVTAGTENWVEVGQPVGPPGARSGGIIGSVTLKTSFEPL